MFISYLFDVIVMGLLATTIAYCYILNTRLRQLRAHESQLRESIAQLFTASKKVEVAVGNLKQHANQAEKNAEDTSLFAEDATIELKRQISEAKLLMNKLQNVVKTAKSQGLSSDKLLNRKKEEKAVKPQPKQSIAPKRKVAAPEVKAVAPEFPAIDEPKPVKPESAVANQNKSQFGRKASNGGEEAIERLEASISRIKRSNGRAA